MPIIAWDTPHRLPDDGRSARGDHRSGRRPRPFGWGGLIMANPDPPEKPPRVQTRILAAPKIRQVYWCDFWRDAHLPEMWKTRPVVVLSYNNHLHSPCLVIPLSTVDHDPNDPWAYKLHFEIDGVASWAVCNMPSTVAPSRFTQFKGGKIPLLSPTDFNEILARLMKWIPRPFPLPNG